MSLKFYLRIGVFALLLGLLAACGGAAGLPETGVEGTALPPAAVLEAQNRLAQELGFPPADVTIQNVEQTEFSDSCLGWGQANESCAAVITPGWQMTATVNGQTYEVRASEDGQSVRWQQPGGEQGQVEAPAPADAPQAVMQAQMQIAQALGVSPLDVAIESFEQAEFSNACLGWAEAGEMCAEVITPGWRVTANVSGQTYEIRASADGQTVRWQAVGGASQDSGSVSVFVVSPSTAVNDPNAVGCGDELVSIVRALPAGEPTIEGALRTLFALGQNIEDDPELYNALQNSQLNLDGVTVEGGTATINLSGDLLIGGECDAPRVEAQIRQTALQFPGVENVEIYLNGEPLASVLSARGE